MQPPAMHSKHSTPPSLNQTLPFLHSAVGLVLLGVLAWPCVVPVPRSTTPQVPSWPTACRLIRTVGRAIRRTCQPGIDSQHEHIVTNEGHEQSGEHPQRKPRFRKPWSRQSRECHRETKRRGDAQCPERSVQRTLAPPKSSEDRTHTSPQTYIHQDVTGDAHQARQRHGGRQGKGGGGKSE